jgi:hypothetical protein
MALVEINGDLFHTPDGPAGSIVPYPVQPLGEAFRIQGAQRRLDNRKVTRLPFDSWQRMGIGWHRMRRDSVDARGVGGMRDANAETRFDTITLPLNAQAVTSDYTGTANVFLKKMVNFKGNLIALASEKPDDGNDVHSFIFDSTNDQWDQAGAVTAGTAHHGAYDMVEHKGLLFVACAISTSGTHTAGSGVYKVLSSADGATWADASGSGFPDATTDEDILSTSMDNNSTVENWEKDMARLLSAGNVLLVAIFEDSDSEDGTVNQVKVGYTTDSGSNWTFNAGLQIPSTDGPKALVLMPDVFTAGTPLIPTLITAEGIYMLDTANNVFSQLLSLGGDVATGRRATSSVNGRTYIGLGSGDILEVEVLSHGNVVITNIGPHTRSNRRDADGLITAKQGHANYIYGDDPRWLFVAYGGHAANKQGSILAFDYDTGAWHSVWYDATSNRDTYGIILSGATDNTTRLHFITEQVSSSSSNDTVMQMIEDPLVGVTAGATQQYASTGYVEEAEDDVGDPHSSAAIYRARVDADGLDDVSTIEAGGGTSNHIELEYGLDGAAWNNVSNLGFFGSDDKQLFFGKTNQNTPSATEAGTPIGVSALTIRRRWVFQRDSTNTNTPKLKEAETEIRNKLLNLEGFQVPIDIGLTAEQERVNPDVIIARINTIISAVTLVTFKKERDAVRYVECVGHSPSSLQSEEQAATVETQALTGVYTLQLEEVLA